MIVCKTTNQAVIKMNGSIVASVPDQNKECVFPFKDALYGEMHYTCTTFDKFFPDLFRGGPAFCGTRSLVELNAGWGLCNDQCPRENTGKINLYCSK